MVAKRWNLILVLMYIMKCNTMAVNADLYVGSLAEFAYLSDESINDTVTERDPKSGAYKFPAFIRCCCLMLLAADCCCLMLLAAA